MLSGPDLPQSRHSARERSDLHPASCGSGVAREPVPPQGAGVPTSQLCCHCQYPAAVDRDKGLDSSQKRPWVPIGTESGEGSAMKQKSLKRGAFFTDLVA